MIPPFERGTGNLPPGIHEATWEELAERFGENRRRHRLLAGLRRALDALQAAGCGRAYIDGSFVTAKAIPGDFDACWEVEGVDLDHLDPVLKTFDNHRQAQKQKYGGELFPADWAAEPTGTTFLDFFRRDKDTQRPKGIIAIDLGGPP